MSYLFRKDTNFIHQVYSPLAISVSIKPNLLYFFFLSDLHLCINYKILEEVEGKRIFICHLIEVLMIHTEVGIYQWKF